MEPYQIVLTFVSLSLLGLLGKRFPLQLGQYIHFWIGIKPKEELSTKKYFLQWAKLTFFYLIILTSIDILGAMLLTQKIFNIDTNPILVSIVVFAMPILIVAGIVKLIEFLVKAYICRDGYITLKQTIYMPLLNEDIDVYRPVEAEYIKVNIYKVISENISFGEEKWKFSSGDYVRCKQKNYKDKK